MVRISGIYLIINTISNKIYVGSSVNIEMRWYEHVWQLNNDAHKNKHLQSSWNSYGEDAFHFCVVEECSDIRLLSVEQLWLDALFGDRCYNKSPVAGNTLGKIHSDETKLKISDSKKGVKPNFTQEFRKVLAERGTKALQMVNELGLNRTPEVKEKQRLKLIGNQRNRKSELWPHGCRCQCLACKTQKKNQIIEARRKKKVLSTEW